MSAPIPEISVVVAAKNAERYLAEALASLRASTLRPAEIVLVDGASTDGTRDVAAAHPEVRVVAQRGDGVADAYNLGVASTSSPLVAFLSADDRRRPKSLAAQADLLAAEPGLAYATGMAAFFLEPGCAPPPGFRRELLGAERPAAIMETLLVRRSALAAVGPFDPSLRSAEDVDWFARARERGLRAASLPRVVVDKRIHDRNTSLDAAANTARLLKVLRAAALRRGAAGGADA